MDWRNPEDYAHLKELNLHEWAWEFLRRNPEYRRAYAAIREATDQAKLKHWRLDPEQKKRFYALFTAATEPWGFFKPADPQRGFHDGRVTFKDRAGVRVLTSWKTSYNPLDPEAKWAGYPDRAALLFDLRYSITVQLEIARDILEGFAGQLDNYSPRAPQSKIQVRQFPLYVRILDAELDGASDGEITIVLFGGNRADPRRSMTKARKTARRMMNGGYRDLLLRPPREIGHLAGTKGPERKRRLKGRTLSANKGARP